MPDYREEDLAEVPYEAILDRSEDETYYDFGSQKLWVPNSEIQRVDEFEQTIKIPETYAKEHNLL
jgi:hypothetical protein